MNYKAINPEVFLQCERRAEGSMPVTLPGYVRPSESDIQTVHHPQYAEYGGVALASYIFNQDTTSPDTNVVPIVALHPILGSNGTPSRRGLSDISTLAAHLKRPIISVDMPNTGASERLSIAGTVGLTPDRVAEGVNAAVDALGYHDRDVDFLGICLGGAVAARAAVQRGLRARSLITIATPGFETDLLPRLRDLSRNKSKAAQYCNVLDVTAARTAEIQGRHLAEPAISELPQIRKAGQLRRLAHWKLGKSLVGKKSLVSTLPDELHAATNWLDLAMQYDAITDWRNHVSVTSRHSNSTSYVIKGAGHRWPLLRIPLTAGLINRLLQG